MKKTILILMAFMVVFAFQAPSYVDAKPFRSGKGFFKKTPTSPNNNVNRSDNINKPGTTKTTTGKGGFFSGGSFAKGLIVGGLAGMLFGGLFGQMGFLGDLLGLMVNLLAIYILFLAIRGIFGYFRVLYKKRQNRNRY